MGGSPDKNAARPVARVLLAALAVLGLLGATAAVSLLTLRDARRDAVEEQSRRADQAAVALQTAMSLTMDRLTGASVALAGEPLGPEDREPPATPAILDHLFGQPALWGAGLALRVPDRDRPALERRLGATVRQPTPAGAPVPAARRDSYVVPVRVRYRDGGQSGLGVDLAADPERRAALERAARMGVPQITAPVAIVGGSAEIVVAYAPIRPPGAEPSSRGVVGYVIGSYRTTLLVEGMRAVVGSGTRFALSDGDSAFGAVEPDSLVDPVRRQVRVGGRQLDLTVARPAIRASNALSIAVSGLAITGLVALLLVLGLRRERRAVLASAAQARGRERAERSFAAAFEQAPIGIAILSTDGVLERCNGAFSALTGYPQTVLVGRTLSGFLHPEDREETDAALRRLVAAEGPLELEQRLLAADGGVMWVALSATLMRDESTRGPRVLLHCENVTDRRAYEARLQHLASHDPLTGLLNRRALGEELERHVTRVRRYGDRGAVLMVDLDHFKGVNDLHGHGTGDRLIIEVARAMQRRLRESDVLSRLGGDEFAVLLPEVDPVEAVRVAEDLLAEIRDLEVPGSPSPRRVTASIGIALTRRVDDLSAEGILVGADLALFDAKEAGRDRAVIYAEGPSDVVRTEARLSWVDRIHRALESDDFVLHYQPVVDLTTGRTVAAEALVRLRQPDGDLVMPGAFLEIAERYGLAPHLDRWVLDHAIADLADLQRSGEEVTVAVNLSALSLSEPTLVTTIERLLRTHGAAPGSLLLELTETAAVSDIPQAQAFARRLRTLGCRLALDDFGAGFGSFYYLKHLPFDVLKIDGEFVRSCVDNPLDRRIVAAIVDIARSTGSTTVGEHAGNGACVEMLKELGVTLGQGFHLGRPAPLADLRARLAAESTARLAPGRD